MRNLKIEGQGATITEAGGKDANGADTATVWTLSADQLEKHRPQFAAEIAALPKADQDRLAVLRAPVKR